MSADVWMEFLWRPSTILAAAESRSRSLGTTIHTDGGASRAALPRKKPT